MNRPAAPTARGAFHLMADPAGAVCTLECGHGFEVAQGRLFPASRFRMEPHVLETYVARLLAAHRDADEVVVSFQGDEPTMMGIDFFIRVLELERRHARAGQRILNTLLTDGTLLDDNWGAFLHAHDFLVGLCVDGPRRLHDAYRVDEAGRRTFVRAMRGLDLLRRYDVQWHVSTTVNPRNAAHGAEVYAFLRDELGASYLRVMPASAAGPGELRMDLYCLFLLEVVDAWRRRDIGVVHVQAFDPALERWVMLGG